MKHSFVICNKGKENSDKTKWKSHLVEIFKNLESKFPGLEVVNNGWKDEIWDQMIISGISIIHNNAKYGFWSDWPGEIVLNGNDGSSRQFRKLVDAITEVNSRYNYESESG